MSWALPIRRVLSNAKINKSIFSDFPFSRSAPFRTFSNYFWNFYELIRKSEQTTRRAVQTYYNTKSRSGLNQEFFVCRAALILFSSLTASEAPSLKDLLLSFAFWKIG